MTYLHRGTLEACIDTVPKHFPFCYAAKWLVFGYFEACLSSTHLIRSQRIKLCCCVASAHFQKSGMITIDVGAHRPRDYQRPEADHSLNDYPWESFARSPVSFSGNPVSIACREFPIACKRTTTCDAYSRRIILQALALLTATMVKAVFSEEDYAHKNRAEKIDIFIFSPKLNYELLTDFDVPVVFYIGAFTLYVKESSTIP